MVVLYILLAIIVLLIMVTIHEFGHYLVGRWLGFKIVEFSVGFGKAIWQKTNKRGELISLRIFPLGGYCSFYGEEGEEEPKEGEPLKEKDPNVFTNQPVWKRILVFAAGVAFNFLSAIIFSFVLLVSYGYGNMYVVKDVNDNFLQYNDTQLTLVEENDKIIKINGEKISMVWDRTVDTMVTNEVGQSCVLTIQKEDGRILDVTLVVHNDIATEYDEETGKWVNQIDEETGEEVYYTGLGLNLAMGSMPLPFLEALLECFSLTIGFAWMMIKTFWLLITFQLPLSALGGPITTISMMADMASQSLSVLLTFLPLISVNLAVFNFLPFPALDGSHIVFGIIEWIRGKPVNPNIENIIHMIGLIILFGFVIVLDILHFIL